MFDSKSIVLVKKISSQDEEPYFCTMNSYSLHYKALIKGGIIALALTIVLIKNQLMIVDPASVSRSIYIGINILSFIFCWLLISFLISKFPIAKILGVLGLLLIAMIAEHYLDIQHNPITIPLVILFWLGVTYLVLPQFFKKYKIAILSVYGFVISYYFFFFGMMSNSPELHRLNFVNFILTPIPAFAALWVYEQWRWLRMLQADKAKAELALLKSQVNPHFFFNTLNNLYGLVVEKSAQAPEVVLKLSDMMRYTIYEGKEERVNLTDEVKYLETYIELHKIRYQKKVDIQFRYDLEKELQLAPLLFIILLENAFKHGAESMTENAYIHLDLKTRDNRIFFTIENNYEPRTFNQNQKVGIGLDNLRQRLTHTYPNRHELRLEKTDTTYTAHLNLFLNSDSRS